MKNPDTLGDAGQVAGHWPGLLLAAERVAQSLMRGVHGRRRVGSGDAFWQFRPYQPGDTSRDIDWRQTAKRDQAFIRQTEWEAAQTVWLYRDASESMNFSSAPEFLSKRNYAEILLLALGIVLLNGGEQVSLLGTASAPQTGYNSIQRIYEMLGCQTHLVENGRPVSAKAHAVLISDFYFPVEELTSFCEKLAARRVSGMLVQVFDPAERTLPYAGRIRFQDAENADSGFLDIRQVEAIRAEYEQKFVSHQRKLEALAQGLGWKFETCSIDMKHEAVIARLYDGLSAHA